MRLMDLVANAGRNSMCLTDGSRRIELRGAGTYATAIRDCPLRYVLGDQVAQLCESLLATDLGMLDPVNVFLRLPAVNFWMEWFREGSLPGSGECYRQRVGCLISSAVDGRSGVLHSFWIDENGKAQAAQVYLEFDLDRLPAIRGPDVRKANHERSEFRALLNHVVVRVEPEWASYFDTLAPAGRDLFFNECAARIWFDLPVAFAFATLLGSESYVATTRSELIKLNRNRAVRGRPALLDHIETRLWMDRDARPGVTSDSTRAAPRLHSVRGHMVRRQGVTFWRMTHLRGDPATSQLVRTVQVGHRR